MPFGKKIYKSYRAETKAVEGEEGLIRAVVSTESVDRDGEVILAKAWGSTIRDFLKHPVLISSHDYNDLTKQLGEWVSLKVTDKGLEGIAKYYINMGNKEADWGYELAKKGKSAYSVGFMSKDYVDGGTTQNGYEPKRTYTDVELLEISQVTVPSNRDALVTMRSKGAFTEVQNELADEILSKEVPNVPSYIRKNARRGLDLLQYAGDGLTEKTKREARDMAKGNISENKVVRMNAWFQRHEGDLKSPNANEYLSGESDRPTAGQVAWLLWGGTIEKTGRMNAQKWAQRVVDSLEDEEKTKAPLPATDQFTTEEEAVERAEEIGCVGFHTMDEDGNTIYMPCETHEDYDEIMNPQEDDTEEDDMEEDGMYEDEYGDEHTKGSIKKTYSVLLTEKEKADLLKAIKIINATQKTEKQTKKDKAEYNVADIMMNAFKTLKTNKINKEV